VVRSQTLNLAKLSTGSLASLLIALVLFALSASLWGFATGIDDAHISFYAAHALATTGEMLNYNGERVEQSSSLLHVLLTALFARISNTNVVTVGYVIPMLAGWLCLPLLWVIARREQLAAATLLCAALPLVYWAHAGLETALFACLLLLYVYYLSLHATRWLALVLCGFALQLARPELPLFVPVLTLSFWVACRFLALPCRAIGLRALLSILTALCIVSWRWYYFGEWFPQPVTAKSAGITLTAFKAGLLYLGAIFTNPIGALFTTASMIALLHLLWRSARGKENTLLVASTLACTGYTALVALTGGDWMPQQRFLAPLVPLQALLLMRSLSLILPAKMAFLAVMLLASSQILHSYLQAQFHQQAKANLPITSPSYSVFETHSPSVQANLPTLAALIPLVASVHKQKHAPVQLLSGQMGVLPYHLSLLFPNQLHFTDRNALVEPSLTNCSLTRERPRVPQGLDGLATIFFIKKARELQEDCGIAPPDIIYDLWWHNKVADARTLLEKHGYTVVHVHEGTTLLQDQLILVRKEWLQQTDEQPSAIAPP
jgi:hypothetical protein